jgi:hypothetical protein
MLDAIAPPIAPSGRARRIEIGTVQLSYNAATHKKIIKIEKA